MEIRLLDSKIIRTEEFYQAFIAGNLDEREDFFSDDYIIVGSTPDFPVYLNIIDEQDRKQKFHEALSVITKYYITMHQDDYMNDVFWYTLLCVHKRDYLIREYPEILSDIGKFRNIVLKKFDWENYIYKCVIAAQYVTDNCQDKEEQNKYFDLIIDNLDLYNYIIKYEIFRNDQFLMKILRIVDKNDLSAVLKMKIKDRDDLGKDERVGRRILLELNKMYPVVISHAMEFDDFEELFMEQLKKYCKV